MVCCSPELPDKFSFILPPLYILLLLVVLIGGALIFVLAILKDAIFLFRVNNRSKVLSFLRLAIPDIVERMLKKPFLLNPAVRCRLGGKFYNRSPRLAGFIFKYFNLLFLFLLIVLSAGLFFLLKLYF